MSLQWRVYLLAVSLGLGGTQVGCGGGGSIMTTVQAQAPPSITVQDLAGTWQATLIGNTGCGLTSMLVTFTLDSSGMATNASNTGHVLNGGNAGCLDGATSTGNTFTITLLNPNGSGTAGLSCGAGCGWNFHIQVAPDKNIFNLVDVDPANFNNLLQGVAIRQ